MAVTFTAPPDNLQDRAQLAQATALDGLTWAQVWALPVGHCAECDSPINGYLHCACDAIISLMEPRGELAAHDTVDDLTT